MKTSRLLGLTVISAAIIGSTITVSCTGKRSATKKAVGQMMNELPCQKDGRSNKTKFRAFAQGKSMNMNAAREMALNVARGNLAQQINTTVKKVTETYMNQRDFGDQSEFEAKFEDLTRSVTKQKLQNISIICDEQSVMPDGRYNKFVAIEIDKDELVNGISNGISKDKKLQIDYDKMKFEQIMNDEMEKLDAAGQ